MLDLGVATWKVTWSCETEDNVLSIPKGQENIPAPLDPLVLVTLSSLIVVFVSSPGVVNASSVLVDRRGGGGDGSSEDVPFPFAAPFFRDRLLLISE